MGGRLIAVVGPSGVGKDTVMRALVQANPRFVLVRRVITRPADAGGEDFDGISEAAFERRRQAGDFTLHWRAHGLHYGIPLEVEDMLANGQDALVNLSRTVLGEAATRFQHFEVLSLIAPVEIRAARLEQRGREGRAAIEKRLGRTSEPLPETLNVIEISNAGPLEECVAAILARLQPVRE